MSIQTQKGKLIGKNEMAEKYQSEQHFDFSGGVNFAVSRLIMADNELNWIENGETEKVGSIYKVRGYSKRGATVSNAYKILGMINGYKPSDGTRKQIVVADGASSADAYTFNSVSNAWTAHGLSLSTGSKVEFESFLDGIFMVNFTEATRFNNLTAWSTSTNVTNAAKARYVKQYLSRLYLGYVVTGGSTYPSKVTYSDLPDTTVSPNTLSWNDTLNYFDVAPDDGDVIMGLEVNANRLLIFKQESIYRYDTNTLYQVPGCPGTVSQRSVKNIQGHTLYLHSTGIWDYDGSQSILISRKIKELIDGIPTNNLSSANGWARGDHYYLYVGDVNNAKTGLSIDDCLIDYDIAKDSFVWRSLRDTPTVWMNYPDDASSVTYNDATISYGSANMTYNAIQSSEQRVFFGTSDGSVMQFDTGNTFSGTAIPFSLETKDYYLGYPAFWKLMEKVYVFNDYAGKGLTVQAKLDDKDWITLGRVDSTTTCLRFPSGSVCQRVRFRLQESSSSERFAFEGLDIYYVPYGLIR